MQALELFRHGQHTFFQGIIPNFELTPIGISAGLIPDGELLLSGVQSQPDIASRIAFADPDRFVEKADIARFVHAADRMDLTGTNGQRVG